MPIFPVTPQSHGYREDAPLEKEFEPFEADISEAEDDNSHIDEKSGAKITVEDDGSVIIDPNPKDKSKQKSDKFNSNLALDMEEDELSSVAEEVLQGIENDIQSRALWDSAYSRGIELMGLKLEDASSEISSTGSVSKVHHPLLIETTVRYQSSASAELLPAAGPVKVKIDSSKIDAGKEELANAFEQDFNHYLTDIAKEYYPDTNQLLFNQGWSGLAFKKVFECPIRKRPCSDLVLAPDLIISNDVVDLESAGRITHRTRMSNGLIRRLQRAGVYRKIEMGTPVEMPTMVENKVAEVSNIMITTKLPSDHRHTIYECYVELDLPGYEKDIPLPYCVTLDKDSRKILSIRRNWEEGDEEYNADCLFVKYGMIPALGFYDIGFVHLLGNTTRALTAILRMQLDAGQFSIFPGFLFSKQAGRQVTTEVRLSPGTGKEIDTGGLPIQQVAMPLPYPGPSQVLSMIAEKTAQDGMRLGMASDIQVGEGRADVPVGTTMAMIEQATKTMSAVHKRNHVAQQREFEKLKKLFMKNPQALSKFSKNPARQWELAEEFADLQLIPASDPNIPSHTHRIMQANALVLLSQSSQQGVFNKRAVAERVLNELGYKDFENLLEAPPQPGAQPPISPELMVKIQDNQIKQQQINLTAQQQAAHDNAKLQETQLDIINKQKDRESRERIEMLHMANEKEKHTQKLISEHLKHDSKLNADHMVNIGGLVLDHHKHHTGLMHEKELEQKKEM